MNPTMARNLLDVSDPTAVAHHDHPDRFVPLEGAFNFRDLGGYPARAGQTLRWRTLYRADALHHLPDHELDTLGALGVRTALDLRTDEEVDAGRIEVDSITHVHLPVLGRTWEPRKLDPDADAGEVLGSLYIEMLDVGAPALAGALTMLADAGRLPAVFHCAAGKDRTGVLAAMVLSLLGVNDEIIIADYSLSGTAMTNLVERLRRERPETLTTMNEQPSAYLAAPPEAMMMFLGHVHREFGSVLGYVRSIGVDGDVVEALNVNLLF